MRPTVFINALREEDKGAAVLAQASAVHTSDGHESVRIVDPEVFSEIPGSPFSYRVSEAVRSRFVRFGAFAAEGRQVRQGLATADDFRFVRLWWEVSDTRIVTSSPNASPDTLRRQTHTGRTWVPFAKGGAYSPYYSDVHLLVNWEEEGRDIKERVNPVTGRPWSNVWMLGATQREYFLRPGITWPRRTGGFSPRCLAAGSIFADKGPAAFADDPGTWLAVLCSAAFGALVDVQIASGGVIGSYEVGVIQRTPVPLLSERDGSRLGALATACVRPMQTFDTVRESTHLFVAPSSTVHRSTTIETTVEQWNSDVKSLQTGAARSQGEIDALCSRLYGLSDADLHADALTAPADISSVDSPSPDTDTEDDEAQSDDLRSTTVSLLSYAVGCAFGRWDIRYATGEKTPPELPDPFAPLPVCSPGMLQGEDGFPLTAPPPGYPLHVNWNGILVDDGSHPDDDIVQRVRKSLHVLWPATSESIEAEMCAALGVKDLREYFRKPGSGGFWMDHVHIYSKSHRKAPIYWLLQSSHKNYGVWLYYQRLDSDLLFKVLQNYVEPKLKLEQNHETEASHKLTAGGLSVSETRQAQKDLEKQQDLVAEIRGFRDTLKKAADLRLTPDLDDGVVLNIAPLHDLVPWVEASKYWDELLAGKYPWSSIGKELKQKGMV